MSAESLATIPSLNVILDVILILAMAGLWLLWIRTSRRQQQLQSLLIEASQQLDTATRHLDTAMQAIERLQKLPAKAPAEEKPVTMTELPRPRRQSDAQATRILRMRREGESPEVIADKLHLPLAQVKLMLKLHSPISHA